MDIFSPLALLLGFMIFMTGTAFAAVIFAFYLTKQPTKKGDER